MDKTKLITIAANSKLLKNLAKKLCNYRYISDDLFQEFLIYLLERPEELLLKKYYEVNFIFYCSCVIRGLNGKRLTANKLVNSKNPLCEKINIFELNGYEATTSEYNYELDAKRDPKSRNLSTVEEAQYRRYSRQLDELNRSLPATTPETQVLPK